MAAGTSCINSGELQISGWKPEKHDLWKSSAPKISLQVARKANLQSLQRLKHLKNEKG